MDKEANVAEKKSPKTASEFLDYLTDLFADVSHLSTEEIEEDLQEMGVDTKKAVQRVKNLVNEKLEESRLAWQKQAERERLAEQERLEKIRAARPIGTSESLWERVEKALSGALGPQKQSYVQAYFRRREDDKVSENDLQNMLDDLERLEHMEDDKEQDE
jgi:hypothetical protein